MLNEETFVVRSQFLTLGLSDVLSCDGAKLVRVERLLHLVQLVVRYVASNAERLVEFRHHLQQPGRLAFSVQGDLQVGLFLDLVDSQLIL